MRKHVEKISSADVHRTNNSLEYNFSEHIYLVVSFAILFINDIVCSYNSSENCVDSRIENCNQRTNELITFK